jgi:PAS domain S-box-containing protein
MSDDISTTPVSATVVNAARDNSALLGDYKFAAWFVGVGLLLVLSVFAGFWAFDQIDTAAGARQQLKVVINNADNFLSELKDAETGQRGYILTGDEAFLEPYTRVSDNLPSHLTELRQLALPGPAQNHLDTLAPLLDAKIDELAQVIALRRNHELPAAIARVANGQGKQLMDTIRSEMGDFIRIEEIAMARQETLYQASMRHLFAGMVVASAISLLLAVLFAYLIYRRSQQKLQNSIYLETQRLLTLQETLNIQLLQANNDLTLSEEKLRVTLNSIGDGLIVTDSEARVTLLNPVAEALTGWVLAEAVGRPIDEIFHIINQETRQPATIPVLATLAHGTIQGLANHTVLIARDGCEYAISDSCAPIRGYDNIVSGAVLVFRDVTREYAAQSALNKSQEVLRESELLFRKMIDSLPIAIYTTDAEGRLTYFNPAAVEFSGQVPELSSDQWCVSWKLFHADGAPLPHDQCPMAITLKENRSRRGEEAIAERPDGTRILFLSYPTPLSDTHGKLIGGINMLEDITERRRAEMKLAEAMAVAEKANLAKSEFLSSMSHELRTPLNAVLGFAQLLESGTPAPTLKQMDKLQQISKAGWYLLELINEILDLALIESGKLSMSQEPVSLAAIMLECQSLIETQAQQYEIKLIFYPFDAGWYVSADQTRVKQILVNLLSNAIKYNRRQGVVEVKCISTAPDRIRISVHDNGEGLPPEKLAQLFQPFNRLGQENGAKEGTGIGLVVTKKLVELMGGAIGVESAVGEGSTFWVELIRDNPPPPASKTARPRELELTAQENAAQLTLLYVEDNPANMLLVEQIISEYTGLTMLSAGNGEQGIALARSHLPNVILMDINLPGISGMLALKILREDPATQHIPILAISANAMPRDIEKGLQAGFFRYLTKPIKIPEFMLALDEALKFSKLD